MANNFVTVTQLVGQAWVRTADGNLQPLRVGMQLPVDAEVVTAAGSQLTLQGDVQGQVQVAESQQITLNQDIFDLPNPSEAAIARPETTDVNALIAALNAGEDPLEELDPTEAVLSGGEGAGSTYVRLANVIETTQPLSLEYPRFTPGVEDNQRLGGAAGIFAGDERETWTVPTLSVSDAGRIEEGGVAVFGINLSNPLPFATTVTFELSGDIEPEDIDGLPSVYIQGQPVPVIANPDGTYSFQLPPGVAGDIEIRLQTTDDNIFEGDETITLTATLTGGDLPAGITDTGVGVITDLEGAGADVPKLTVDDAGTVQEGQNAVFQMALDKAIDAETTMSFKLNLGTAEADDVGNPSVFINGAAVTVSGPDADGNYTFQVPAGTTDGIEVRVPTTDDLVYEGAETFTLDATLTG
ncbi:MAG: retention module-containing protein, partial [Comamonas sp.]